MDENLLQSLPYHLKREIATEYLFKIKELHFFLRTEKKIIKRQKIIEYLIFIGIFYRRIIKPIDGTLLFSYKLMNAGAKGLKVGHNHFTKENNKLLYKIVKEFEKILSDYNIPAEILEYESINDFLKNLDRFEGRYE